MRLDYTVHAKDMLIERRILEAWIVRTIESPLRTEENKDGTTHYLGSVPERGDRILRVVMNTQSSPPMVVTVFFDRRLRRQS